MIPVAPRRCARAIVLLAATLALSIGPRTGLGATPEQARLPDGDLSHSVQRRVAMGNVPALVWIAEGASGISRVHASVPPEAPPIALGPAGDGSDDGLSVAATPTGSILVAASRHGPDGSRLWSQEWSQGRWGPPAAGPRVRGWDHAPVLAVGGDDAWLAWLSEDDGGPAALFAAARTDDGWGVPLPLPRSPGEPAAFDLAVLDDGSPVVVWTAEYGGDAEIWTSRLDALGWAAPRRLSRNGLPDVLPRVATDGRRILATWSSFDGSAYVPVAREGSAPGEWGPIHRLASVAGHSPVAVHGDGSFAVLWVEWRSSSGRWTIRVATTGDDGWSRPADLTSAASPRFDAVAAPNGRVALSWSAEGRDLTSTEGSFETLLRRGRDPAFTRPTPASSGPSSAARTAGRVEKADGVPRNYLGYGDSVTAGVVQEEDGSHSIIPGYPARLEERLESLIGIASVPEAGVGGEMTDAGLARIDDAIAAHRPDSIMILEGFNDISNLVPASTTVFNLRQMVQASLQAGLLTFIGLLPPRFHAGGFEGPPNRRTDAINDGIRNIAEETAAGLVDLHTPFDGHPELYSDRIHPNREGYQVMGDTWFEGMRPAVLATTNRGDLDDSGRVDGIDLVELSLAFGSSEGDPRYLRAADVNLDGVVDGLDLSIMAEFFAQDVGGS